MKWRWEGSSRELHVRKGCPGRVLSHLFCLQLAAVGLGGVGGGHCWARAGGTRGAKQGRESLFPSFPEDLTFHIKFCYFYNLCRHTHMHTLSFSQTLGMSLCGHHERGYEVKSPDSENLPGFLSLSFFICQRETDAVLTHVPVLWQVLNPCWQLALLQVNLLKKHSAISWERETGILGGLESLCY